MGNKSNIVFLGQSLTNDGTNDIWINSQYFHTSNPIPAGSTSKILTEFRKQLKSALSKPSQYNDEISFNFTKHGSFFEVDGVERDNRGRIAPICIRIPNDVNFNEFKEAFDKFLSECGRQVSSENMDSICEILENRQKYIKRKKIAIGVIAGAIIGGCIGGYIGNCIDGCIDDNNKLGGVVLGAVLGSIVGGVSANSIQF